MATSHRGAAPKDAKLFSESMVPILRESVGHYSWLLTRGYAQPSALKIVGDRFHLVARQRDAIKRAACSDADRDRRAKRMVAPAAMKEATVQVDGFNVITSLESALGGGLILHCRDGCFRDLASMHGSYRRVEETLPAIGLLGEALAEIKVNKTIFYLDRPVSNSGRLKSLLLGKAKEMRLEWGVVVVANPDPILENADEIVATADHGILDQTKVWFNLARYCVEKFVPGAWIVRLG